MLAHNGYMAKKTTSTDRHKPGRMVRVKESLASQLDRVAEANATNISIEVNRAVRELLERAGLWPPRPE